MWKKTRKMEKREEEDSRTGFNDFKVLDTYFS